MPRLRRVFKIIGYNAGILIAGVVCIELVFGNWLRGDPLHGLYLLRNGSWRFEVDYPGIADQDRSVVYSRDRFALRGDYGRPADIDILTVGGSTTDQRYVDDDATWQAVMADNFRREGLDVRIANAGVNGRTTFGHLHDFDLWFPRIEGLAPSHVLLYTGINDMFFDQPNGRFDDAREPETLKRFIRHRSALVNLYRTVLGMYRAYRRNLVYLAIDYRGAEWTDTPLQSDYRSRLRDRLEGYATRMRMLIDRIEAMGAVPVVVTQPRGDSRIRGDGAVIGLVSTSPRMYRRIEDSALGVLEAGTANGVDYHHILSLFNEVSLAECRRAGGICIDLAGELRFGDGDFYDHAHTTRQGSRKIGDFLYRAIGDEFR